MSNVLVNSVVVNNNTNKVNETSTSSIFSPIINEIQSIYYQFISLDKRQLIHQILSLLLIVCSALMIFKGLVIISGSDSPVVVVVSGSMEPAFYRGDILLLWLGTKDFELGEIVVFKIQGKETPIVHRIVEIHQIPNTYTANNGSMNTGVYLITAQLDVLTKGDNNQMDDRAGIYNYETNNQIFLHREDIMGRAIGYLPYFGYITITLTDYPAIKYCLIAIMAGVVILSKD